jgi:hypothetical protein
MKLIGTLISPAIILVDQLFNTHGVWRDVGLLYGWMKPWQSSGYGLEALLEVPNNHTS